MATMRAFTLFHSHVLQRFFPRDLERLSKKINQHKAPILVRNQIIDIFKFEQVIVDDEIEFLCMLQHTKSTYPKFNPNQFKLNPNNADIDDR